jgi:hypothetical protein
MNTLKIVPKIEVHHVGSEWHVRQVFFNKPRNVQIFKRSHEAFGLAKNLKLTIERDIFMKSNKHVEIRIQLM